jgi:hypothetical protein
MPSPVASQQTGSAVPKLADAPAPSTPAASPEPEPPLYSIGDQIYTVDHDVTAFYYFRENRDGSGKAKYEIRYDRNLWNTCAQLQVRLPFITRWPTEASSSSPNAKPYTGFGNAELRYSYNVIGPSFDHSFEGAVTLPTESNGVAGTDWQLKLFYNVKWKWGDGSVAYGNQLNQTVIAPPGTTHRSYYEGKLTLPNYAFGSASRGLNVSAIYDYRLFFNATAPDFRSAAGGIIGATTNDVALNLVGTWGLGVNGLWKYKIEAAAVARF